jgi:hypothetical protein
MNSQREPIISIVEKPRAAKGHIARGRDGSSESVSKMIADVHAAWPSVSRREPYYPAATWTAEGLKLGAGTRLAQGVVGQEARLLALLSVAYNKAWPASILESLKRAEREFRNGNHAKAAMHIALADLRPLAERENARRLHFAAAFIDEGLLAPIDLMKACEIDGAHVASVTKYSPDQPRVPAGASDGGQWTRENAGEIGSENRDRQKTQSKPFRSAILLPDGCEQEWQEAMAYCLELLAMPNPPRRLTGGHTTVQGCAKGFVSQRCGGNAVTKGVCNVDPR